MLMVGSSKNNRENYSRKCFWTQEKETSVKFNPGLRANRPSNNWAQRISHLPFQEFDVYRVSFPYAFTLLLRWTPRASFACYLNYLRNFITRGGTWVFFGWVCAALDSKLAPRSKKIIPLKLIPRSENRPIFYTPF